MENKDPLITNGFMFIYARQNKPVADKIVDIEKILNSGADINYRDANNNNNTILHIATERDEKELVEYLLKKGALLLSNSANKTPVDVAKDKNTVLSKDVINILIKHEKRLPRPNVTGSKTQQGETNLIRSISHCINNPQEVLYTKRKGTSGASGQFYETKLLSLILYRALHDDVIEECYLATNISDIGEFDDVCFRFKMLENGKPKHVICFIQAKHREDPNATLTVASVRSPAGDFGLGKYFDSFLKIKHKFLKKSKTRDPMFEGEFCDIECYFILYTTLKEGFNKKLIGNKPVCPKMHKFISTGKKEDVFQFQYEIVDILFLTDYLQREHIKTLGIVFLNFVMSANSKNLMVNELIQIYHPALAQYVVKLKRIDPNTFEGQFREEFFDTNDDLLIILKETFCNEIISNRAKKKKTTLKKDDVKRKIINIYNCPCGQTISALIGEVLFFDAKNSKLRLDGDKISRNEYKQEDIQEINQYLQKVVVTQSIINHAINIIGTDKLKLLKFKLPYTFGNTDFPSKLKEEQEPKDRLNFLADKFAALIREKKQQLKETIITYPVEICICDENVGPQKTLELSHLDTKGIGGTVGNLLKFDSQSQTFIFNTDETTLGRNSKYMLREIQKLTQEDLTNFKIKVTMNTFPRSSFDANENDRKLAEEFLSKLWFYTSQDKEDAVETTLKREIDKANKCENQLLFRVHSDAIFLRFHDEIQKWWKSQSEARYLTKNNTIFEEAKKDIIDSPVLTVLNVMFVRSLRMLHIQFNSDVINSMDLEKLHENKRILNIYSDVVVFTAMKIMQFMKYQRIYTFVNLDYVQNILPEDDYNQLTNELKEMTEGTLVIVCETSLNERHQDTLNKIIENYKGKIIIVTNQPLQDTLHKINDYVHFNDHNISLNHLDNKSQVKILTEHKIRYQGKEVPLNTIIEDDSKYLIRAKMLWSILNNIKIDIGQTLNSEKYDEIKDHYINRSLFRNNEEYEVNTLTDIEDEIVLITSKPCMGKTILLTHLSLETKKIDPKPWIVRINMSARSNDFAEWPDDDNVHITNVMRFLCKAAFKTTIAINNFNFDEVTDETIELDRDISEDIPFELELFIHFYNHGKIIFLIDGFERICPHFTKQGIELLNALKRAKKRMWVTGNCYVINILERELVTSYKLERLSTQQQESFLRRFWKTNLQLEKLNHQQFENISMFLNYFVKIFEPKNDAYTQKRPVIHFLSIPLHHIYIMAAEYFKNEINSLSPRFIRETIKKKWSLNKYTRVDQYLRSDEEQSLELAGTPLHMYIAANYFKLQITDKFDLHLDTDVIISRSNVYLNTMNSYRQFLKNNIKDICQNEERNTERAQEEARESYFETHKKLALYAICKESDISKLLTEREIRDVKSILKKIESGEVKSDHIDCVINGIPKFYNLVFAEYFAVEFATDLLRSLPTGDPSNIKLESMWDFLVNGLILCCPPGVRNAFEYKLKNEPELIELASNEKNDKIIFDLILKQDKEAKYAGRDKETCLNIAINEGLVNVTNLLLQGIHRYVKADNADGVLSLIKSGAFILGSANPKWKNLTDIIMSCIQNVDGENLIKIINSTDPETMSHITRSLCTDTEMAKELHKKIKKDICEPIKNFSEKVVATSSNDNLSRLFEILPYHLPGIVNSLFGKYKQEDDLD